MRVCSYSRPSARFTIALASGDWHKSLIYPLQSKSSISELRSYSQFAEKLNMDEEEEAERWIANLITATHLDAKIDCKNVSYSCWFLQIHNELLTLFNDFSDDVCKALLL